MQELIEGVSRFREQVFPVHGDLYRDLASHGQSPKALVISCSDSRVVPEIITQSGPGDIFVCRNAGNLVPVFDGASDGVTSAIEYAVAGLGVRHIVVCGHTDCGAMKGVMRPDKLVHMPNVARWLDPCRCAHSHLLKTLQRDDHEPDAVRRLAMANVKNQLDNLRTHPCVGAGLAHGDLTLHGWLFDIAEGEVLALNEGSGVFVPLHQADEDRGSEPKQPPMRRDHLLLEL